MNILVVDDDKAYLEMIKLVLNGAFDSVKIKLVTNGADAIDICQHDNIDLILLDFYMPKMNGSTVAKLLQHTNKTKEIPIIFVTSSSYSDFEKEGFEIGSVDYISKPIEKNLLINRVALYLTIIHQNKLLQDANYKLEKKVHKVEDQNKMQEQMLIHQSKTSVMGEMIGAIAHQWRQPLNIIATSMINLETKAELDMLDYKEIKRINSKVNSTLQFLSKTIDDFRNFFLSSKVKEKIDMVKVIDSTIELVKTQFTSHNISIEFQFDEEVEYIINGYFNELRQVILNLFANSKDALELRMKKVDDLDGLITIKLNIIDTKLEILICDNGGGIPKDIIKKVFVPYFTTKFVDQGTGIGLYLSKTIIEKLHNGSMNVDSEDDNTCFKILLPMIKI
ncbi:MAG: hybrid sensor histidine kinase/response regulator [Arcobacteraceae bacterium]|nr:hybrid sensor histidine kinase/response regulator [Arcobacteraceae bacterium]